DGGRPGGRGAAANSSATSPALLQPGIGAAQTSVSRVTSPRAIISRNCASPNGPACWPLSAAYQSLSAMMLMVPLAALEPILNGRGAKAQPACLSFRSSPAQGAVQGQIASLTLLAPGFPLARECADCCSVGI